MENAGRDPTTEGLIQGMEMIKDWKPEGLGAPVTFGSDRHHGNNGSRMDQAKGGKVVALEPYTIHKAHF